MASNLLLLKLFLKAKGMFKRINLVLETEKAKVRANIGKKTEELRKILSTSVFFEGSTLYILTP